MIEIVTSAPLATVQDLGREGYRRFGVGTAGAMDRLALQTANLMLGNDPNAAALEIPASPFALRFDRDVGFALTGADCAATLDDRLLPPWWAASATAGQTLRLQMPRRGTNAYVALSGGIDVPLLLGSRSTHLRGAFGGFAGRSLQAGDVLAAGEPARAMQREFGVAPPDLALPFGEPRAERVTWVRVLPAAEYRCFRDDARDALWTASWKISAQSNRAGYRLTGPDLILNAPLEMRSHGLVPGVIQVPHGGQPIIQLADAYTAGGYPKIGTVIEADLWRIAQAPLGTTLRFRCVSYDEALDAAAANAAYLDRQRFWCDLQDAASRRKFGPAMGTHADDLRAIVDWLALSHLSGIEIATASGIVRMAMAVGDAVGSSDNGPVRVVTSPAPGRFHTAHPHRSTRMAAPASAVRSGDVLALLASGVIYEPILAPCDGIVLGCLAIDGTLMGYGAPAFLMQPTA